MKWVWVAVMALVALGGAENSDSQSYASGNVTFITDYPALQVIDIPNGTLIYTVKKVKTPVLTEKIKYVTTENATIELGQIEVTVPCQAVEQGPESNIGAYEIQATEIWMFGVSRVENREPITTEEIRSSSVLTHFL